MAFTQHYRIIVSLVIMCRTLQGAPPPQCGSEHSINGMMLKGHIFQKIRPSSPTATALDCLRACNNDNRCQSFNYVISQSMCELNDRTKEAKPEDFLANSDRYYYRRYKDRVALGSIPELPADSCWEIKASEGQAVDGKYWFNSIKPATSVLAYCDMETGDIDECDASVDVCDVNAVCTNTHGSFVCTCKPGFAGNGMHCAAPLVTVTSSCADLTLQQTNISGIILSTSRSDYNYDSNSDYHYSNNMKCHWSSSSNTKLELTFFIFSTQDDLDVLEVYDGGSPSSPLIGTFSGNTMPTPITSSSNQLHIIFSSNDAVTSRGFRAGYRAIMEGTIRLKKSDIPLTGRVEIFHNDQWGTICSDDWDLDDAMVVCRQLGFPEATQAYGNVHGNGSGPVWMANASCLGNESFLYECSHSVWGNHDCNHGKDASVQCSYGSSLVRLVDGGSNHGRIEVYYNATWGTVCDDYGRASDPNVVCRQLGFPGALEAPCCAAYGEGLDSIWLDDVQCTGQEATLLDCPHNGWGSNNCDHSEDISVVCYS